MSNPFHYQCGISGISRLIRHSDVQPKFTGPHNTHTTLIPATTFFSGKTGQHPITDGLKSKHAARRQYKWNLAHVVYRTAVNIWPSPSDCQLARGTADIHVSNQTAKETNFWAPQGSWKLNWENIQKTSSLKSNFCLIWNAVLNCPRANMLTQIFQGTHRPYVGPTGVQQSRWIKKSWYIFMVKMLRLCLHY